MENFDEQILQNLKDWIGDALSTDEITPEQIVDAIRGELTEMIDYHSAAASKAKEVLARLDTSRPNVRLGNYEGLTSDYMNDPNVFKGNYKKYDR